ncbi:NAM-like protein [Striga asiatica]|uniref:NAM-like protein n=1 Tax=Striga asiatica TaxID=4170 RepID=A0A5A7RDS9_STRAF|nr:NAM-like protein [Striga asiatica]
MIQLIDLADEARGLSTQILNGGVTPVDVVLLQWHLESLAHQFEEGPEGKTSIGGGAKGLQMQPPIDPSRPRQQRRGGQEMHRVMAAGGPNSQLNDGVGQTGRVEMRSEVQGRLPPCPPMAGLFAGDNDDPLAKPYSGSDAPSASFEDMANGNTFLNVEVTINFKSCGNGSSLICKCNGNGSTSMKWIFSNMMVETNLGDFDNYSNTNADHQSQAMQVSPAVPSARPNHKRSKNFSDHEDEVLVSAWLNISLDPVVGKNQKGGRRQSGTTMQDKVAEACALYKAEDQHNKAFQFMHCWNKLRTQPKWLAKLDEFAAAKTSNKKQKSRPTADPSATSPSEVGQDAVEDLDANALTRPIGKKKAKAALLQEKKKSVTATLENMWAQLKETDGEKELKKDQRFNKAFALEQERVANEKLLLEVRSQEVQLQRKRDEERIMTMDLSAMPDEQKKYYMCLRAEIMSRVFN